LGAGEDSGPRRIGQKIYDALPKDPPPKFVEVLLWLGCWRHCASGDRLPLWGTGRGELLKLKRV